MTGGGSPRRPLALVLLVVAGLAACHSDAPEEDSRATVQIRGVYVRPMYEGQAAVIDHEPVFDRMPAMQMAFKVYTPALLDSLEPGDKVRITVDSVSLTTITAIEPLSPETVLNLYEGGGGRGGVLLPDTGEL